MVSSLTLILSSHWLCCANRLWSRSLYCETKPICRPISLILCQASDLEWMLVGGSTSIQIELELKLLKKIWQMFVNITKVVCTLLIPFFWFVWKVYPSKASSFNSWGVHSYQTYICPSQTLILGTANATSHLNDIHLLSKVRRICFKTSLFQNHCHISAYLLSDSLYTLCC